MSAARKVSIRPGVSVLSVLRHLNYRPWFALAEFVDNALQSYIESKSKIHELHGPAWKLKVSIDIDTSHPGRITIRDNAGGIAADAFPRAFRPAVIPPDRSGLSEFGMGMKSAACWFAPKWQVRTKALGEPVVRTVRFDIATIVRDELEELDIDERPAAPNEHFTEVSLDERSRRQNVRQDQGAPHRHLQSLSPRRHPRAAVQRRQSFLRGAVYLDGSFFQGAERA
jgi:hypothetical protein